MEVVLELDWVCNFLFKVCKILMPCGPKFAWYPYSCLHCPGNWKLRFEKFARIVCKVKVHRIGVKVLRTLLEKGVFYEGCDICAQSLPHFLCKVDPSFSTQLVGEAAR